METDMRISIPVLPIGAAVPARALNSVIALVLQAFKAFARARRNRRQALALAGLDRSMLKDIGITRSDLNDAFSSPFWEDPTALLHERAIERRLGRALVRKSVVPRERATEPGFTRPSLDRPAKQAI
jgi:uncharacterized protein YjiS (DUF1127 family)